MTAFASGAERAEEEQVPAEPADGTPGGSGPAGAAGAEPAATAAAGGAPAPGPPTGGLGSAEGELDRVAAERDEYLEALRRLQAEFDNFRKRTARQQAELADRAAEGLLERLLPALDAIDLALAHRAGAAEGDDGGVFAQIASLLRDGLARDGLERIDAAGVHFDPEIHDAVAHLPAPGSSGDAGGPGDAGDAGEGETGAVEAAPGGAAAAEGEPGAPGGSPSAVVAEVLRAGYRLKGRVLRPAMVTVQG